VIAYDCGVTSAEKQRIKRRLLRSLARDGFRLEGSQLRRSGDGIVQTISAQVSSIGCVDVEVDIWAETSDGGSPTELFLCSRLGVFDGSLHINLKYLELEFLAGLSEAEHLDLVDKLYDTALAHFFQTFCSREKCIEVAQTGRISQMGVITLPNFRTLAGLPESKPSKWTFYEGIGGDVDVVGALTALADHSDPVRFVPISKRNSKTPLKE
jgi:hypothetical protein